MHRRTWLIGIFAVLAFAQTLAYYVYLRDDPGNYNGACLLGLKGIVIKSHGSADVHAFGHALARAVETVRNDVVQRIARQMEGVHA